MNRCLIKTIWLLSYIIDVVALNFEVFMMKKLWKMVLSILCVSLIWFSGGNKILHADTLPNDLGKAVTEIENLDEMRSHLASFLESTPDKPTPDTFKQVCKPVGMKMKQLGEENGWQTKQIAKKYRNPNHAPQNLQEVMALAKFEQDENLKGFWQPEIVDGVKGTKYYRRINVESSCLACHGLKNERPSFVQQKYPQDLAYNFHVGDLRGMYSVFIPEDAIEALKDN